MPVISSLATSAWSGVSVLSQASRRAVQVTSVTLTRTDGPGARATGAELTVSGAPSQGIGTYGNPLLAAAAEAPLSGTDLASALIEDLRSKGSSEIDARRSDLRSTMATALGVRLTDDLTLTELRDMAAEAGDRTLTAAADSFAKRADSFATQMGKLDAALSLVQSMDQSATGSIGPNGLPRSADQYVHRAIRDVVEMRLAPEKLDQELSARRGAMILQLTGASDDLQDRMLALRRATGAAAVQAKRSKMIKQLTTDWQEGRITASISQKSAWAAQTVGVDATRATGTTVTYRDEYDHFASASVSLAAGTLFQTTLGRL